MRYSVLLGSMGFALGMLLFLRAPAFTAFIVPIVFATILLFLSGSWVDRSRTWHPWVLVVFVLILMFGYTVVLSSTSPCVCTWIAREHVVTGTCELVCSGCFSPPWYWVRSENCESRFDELLEQRAREHCADTESVELCVGMYIASWPRGPLL
jgi:energy-coupling factor transporter transmembrane protein EcfT